MEIRPTSGISETQKTDVANLRAQTRDTMPGTRPGRGDESVNLTDSARQLHDLQGAVAGTPAVDHARVTALRTAIANGSYQIDAQRIADGLLAQEHVAAG
ncbi:MAG TPA: flagellar biosynthesis anti-sigma factor FlgM [Gammaproteobacteria bacterium]|uniref:flagellar biosynthesis anti-sigma factor FlgM n=1 Tax=Immundisolibacter sp. TaxID=1934948 RepID=UPI000E914050|nr:flagellar biosynthesis anti-sigma factor FlgM [Gammaproteobacteria bacterium]HCZ48797.1 flagellar biosynthesis anti-sigma factor FlgM [Gammaproteobacteria bacterium]MCH78235.1 flagellar biosynthesis anti-sigma factor FlgM [Gammaproteobacteria bacterium]